MGESHGSQYRSGLLFGILAYTSWGLVPLYFWQVKEVGPLEILAQRITWSVVLLLGLTLLFGQGREVIRVLRTPRIVLPLLFGAVMLALNWLLYIYAAVTQRVNEASLGYFMMPLVNAALATFVLGEKLRPPHYLALIIVAAGVSIPFLWAGEFLWIPVALAVSFGIYGLVRKQAPVESLVGLTVETFLLLGPSLGYLIWQMIIGEGKFGQDPYISWMLVFSGVVTIVPLLTFGLSLRRLPLLAHNFMQFLSPTIQLLIAVFVNHEHPSRDHWMAIACVWVAVMIFIADAVVQAKFRAARIVPPLPIRAWRGDEKRLTARTRIIQFGLELIESF